MVVWEVLLQEISIKDRWICKDVQREKRKCKRGNNFESRGHRALGKHCRQVLIFRHSPARLQRKVEKVVTLVRNSLAVRAAPLSLDAINEQTKANHN